jgi:prefoldin subunit 5
MKNIYEVIRQKESELQQLQKDLETLRAAARLLDESETDTAKPARAVAPAAAAVAREPVLRQFP